jgi:zinc protease
MASYEIVKQVLANGLTVLICEMHHAPVASLWLWFRVGGRNEKPGLTGISHWVEHMMFKGTPKVPKGGIDRLISREGGYANAMTWVDWTAYNETLPAQRIELALEIEADRMVNALFAPQEVEAERTVIISERQGAENDPGFRLAEAVQATAFCEHPYRHMVIGSLQDLRTMTRDDLYDHYRRYYVPHNAILVLAGDVERDIVLPKIESLFGAIPAGQPLPPVDCEEPAQTDERRVTVEGEGTTTYVELVFHAPRATDPDFFPMLAANAVMSGIGRLSAFGNGAANRSSRLYKALVETELAVSVAGSLPITLDPHLYNLAATVRAGRSAQEVEDALWGQIAWVVNELASQEELTKAIKQAKAHFAYSSESVTNQASWFGFAETLGDYTWFTTFIDQLDRVTPKDVRRVANKYLTRQNCTAGWYVPKDDSGTARLTTGDPLKGQVSGVRRIRG